MQHHHSKETSGATVFQNTRTRNMSTSNLYKRTSSSKKRGRSIYQSVQELDEEDVQASTKQKSSSLSTLSSSSNSRRQKQNRLAAVSQQKIHTKLLEVRILLQRSIQELQQRQRRPEEQPKDSSHHNNKDPATDSNEHDTEDDVGVGNDDTERKEAIEQCNCLLEQLLVARATLLVRRRQDDPTAGPEAETTDYSALIRTSDDSSDGLERTLETEYQIFEKDWQHVLNQRHKEVRLHAGLTSSKTQQFRVLDASFWEQVQQTVRHEEFVQQQQRQQEQTKSSDVLNSNDTTNNNKNNGSNLHEETKCFDDMKVYQQVLKDFLSASTDTSSHHPSSGTASTIDATALRGSLAAAQRRKRAVHNTTVDRRASKGRKIRYTPIPKLAFFTYPLSRPTSGHILDEDAWFSSLFGGAAAKTQRANRPE